MPSFELKVQKQLITTLQKKTNIHNHGNVHDMEGLLKNATN